MKIVIEAQRIFRKKKHGMDFVALETIRQLQKIDKKNEYTVIVAPGEDHCVQETENFKIKVLKCPNFALWEQVALPEAVRKIKPDLLHCTSNTAPLNLSVPLVLTLHDVIFLDAFAGSNPNLYQKFGRHYRCFVVPRLVEQAKQIITVSNQARGEIIKKMKVDPAKVVTVYNGYGEHFHVLENYKEITHKYIPFDDYIFLIGNTDPRKNTPRSLKAYSLYVERCKAEGREPKRIVVADLGWEVIDAMLKAEGVEWIKELIHLPGYIPNADLPAIFNGAFIFMFASLRESFGIPQLEGMACGTPVITSLLEAVPEIAGEGSLSVDAMDAQSIADALTALDTDKALYDKQVAYGLERCKKFSWEKTARGTLKVYKEVYDELHKK